MLNLSRLLGPSTFQFSSGMIPMSHSALDEISEALMWATRAADRGSTTGCFRSAAISFFLDDKQSAREWCEAAMQSCGSADTKIIAGKFAHWQMMDRTIAKKWLLAAYTQAVKTGERRMQGHAAYQLGWIGSKEGNLDNARHWWEKARDAGHNKAKGKLKDVDEATSH
jgi:TPR repeat protein